MCGAKFFALLFFLALLSPAWSQSFDPAKMYQVAGAELNALEQALIMARAELEALRIENEKLKTDSKNKEAALIALQTQLTTVSESLTEYAREDRIREWIIGVGAFIGGAGVYFVVSHIITP